LKGFLSESERVASLAVVCPAGLDTRSLALMRERLLVITGDRGPGARRVQAGLSDLPLAILPGPTLHPRRAKMLSDQLDRETRPCLQAVLPAPPRRVAQNDYSHRHQGTAEIPSAVIRFVPRVLR
jgi:hypothetical protein